MFLQLSRRVLVRAVFACAGLLLSGVASAQDPAYFNRYDNLKMSRQDGILTVTMHSHGDALVFGAVAHEQFADAFYEISRDRANRVVILTGAGKDWMSSVDFASFGDVTIAGNWAKLVDEGEQILENIANIHAPVICAVNGKAWVHTEFCLLANYIVAADDASFMDAPHFAGNIVPGDGIFTTWSYVAGPNRAQSFLLLPHALSAKEAQAWGVVNEVVPPTQLLGRAQAIAQEWNKKSALTLRYTRRHFIQPLKEKIVREVGTGLTLEGDSAQDSFGKK